MPEVAVGYYSEFYIIQFASSGLKQMDEILWESWRNSQDVLSSPGFSQGIMFFAKDE